MSQELLQQTQADALKRLTRYVKSEHRHEDFLDRLEDFLDAQADVDDGQPNTAASLLYELQAWRNPGTSYITL